MTAKIVAFVITLLVNIAAGVIVFFFMLLAMNGFSESDATYGLVAYIALAVLVSFLMATLAVFAVRALIKREFSGAVSGLIAVPIFSIVGVGLKIVCSVVGVLIAEFVRTNY